MIKLAELKQGEEGIIDSFSDTEMSLKLMEMGCVPGEKVSVERSAPFGDPIAISISGYLLSVRKEEADTVIIQKEK
jgi:ferrous iron transport protein A